jgi:hypothetical protein
MRETSFTPLQILWINLLFVTTSGGKKNTMLKAL